jgi:general secretion pathway protein G
MRLLTLPSKALRHLKPQRGFTLLEMLVVLVIIGLVASLVGPQLLGRVDSSRVTAADTQVRMLKGALDTLRLDVGRYPTAEEGLALLMITPSDERTRRKWQGPYLAESVPLDPWGSPYQYKPKNSTSVVLFSFGADGKAGGEGMDADVGFLDSTSP